MRAREQTDRMLRWFQGAGVTLHDVAVRRRDGTFLSEHSCGLEPRSLERCLAWARFENTAGADVYIRPAPGHDWPVVFLDDVSARCARAVASRYGSLVVRTSAVEEGGCHLWLRVSAALDEARRKQVQRWLARRAGADPASTSGEHWGRLAGMRNHKRGGVWVNVVGSSRRPPWEPARVAARLTTELSRRAAPDRHCTVRQRASEGTTGRDESVAEFAWCCHQLSRGAPPDWIEAALTERAQGRGKRNPEQYARRTVRAALDRLDRRV